MMNAINENHPPNYSSMTVNDRLLAPSLVDAFDDAARRRDRDKMIELLRGVEERHLSGPWTRSWPIPSVILNWVVPLKSAG